MNEALFFLVIFATHVVQGITGFAGTMLAMPFSVFLIGIGSAKSVMNLLGISSGLQICLTSRQHVERPALRRILAIMFPGMLAGYAAVGYLRQYEHVQLLILGAFIFSAGMLNLLGGRVKEHIFRGEWTLNLLLLLAGVVHGMFACGGSLLVVYMGRKVPEKNRFRATLATVWVILNSINLLEHVARGHFDSRTVVVSAIAIPLVFCSIRIGGALLRYISQAFFVKLTNILLALSGLSLILR